MSKLNLLVAYPYFTKGVSKVVEEHSRHIRLVVDSGAFTSWKLGKTITLDEYCNFIENLPIKPWRYFTLDVIGDPEETINNYETMLKRGFKPVPIFTRGESPEILERYYQTSDLVGIGGLVGTQKNKGFVRGIMDYVNMRKVHWLGFTNSDFIKYYKPYMCDSSSWESGARFAVVNLYKGYGKFLKISKTDFQNKPNKELEKLLISYGFTSREMAINKNWEGGHSVSRRLGARSYVRASLDYENKLGTKMFLAAATDYAIKLLLDNYKKEICG